MKFSYKSRFPFQKGADNETTNSRHIEYKGSMNAYSTYFLDYMLAQNNQLFFNIQFVQIPRAPSFPDIYRFG